MVVDLLRSRCRRLSGVLLIALAAWSTPWVTPAAQRPAGLSSPVHLNRAPGAVLTRAKVVPVQRIGSGLLAKGKLLVASEGLGDPHFAETVVLLLDYSDEGAMGVLINRSTDIKLAKLLPRVSGLEQRSDTIFEGGPVERSEILMLVRSDKEPEDSKLVFGDVYISSSAELLKRLAADAPAGDAPFRVYSGYAGWAGGQLETEVGVGAWHIVPATTADVFSSEPGRLWQDLIGRATMRFARAQSFGSVGTALPLRASIFPSLTGFTRRATR